MQCAESYAVPRWKFMANRDVDISIDGFDECFFFFFLIILETLSERCKTFGTFSRRSLSNFLTNDSQPKEMDGGKQRVGEREGGRLRDDAQASK